MPFSFTEDDLLVDISREELDGIAGELVELGQPEPIATTIPEQVEKVESFTRRYLIPEPRLKEFVRALVLYELQSRLAAIPPKRQTKYENAMRELREIRDGKFPDLAIKDPLPSDLPSRRGRWGSSDKLTTR